MSFFDKAFDKVTNSVSNPLEEIGGKVFDEISPIGKSPLDNLNIVNSMRGASGIPEGFPSFDDVFSKNLPGADLLKTSPADLFTQGTDKFFPNGLDKLPQLDNLSENFLPGGLDKALANPGAQLSDAFGSFSGLVKGDGLKDILGGQNPFGNVLGGERSFLSALGSAPQMLSEAGIGKAFPGMEQFGQAFESANPALDFLGNGGDTAGGISSVLGSSSLGGALGSLGLDGIGGGPGGLLGSLSGLLGEGGIESLIGTVTEVIGKILPLVLKLAPLAFGIIL
ncbi:MAG: hypothetical protein K2X77_16840 [Candidatus Obscuribacterales bacterium]|jgi:hypothetical protein|nr:hypothetical protein [Candidatus Obscuribacterales bacterium]